MTRFGHHLNPVMDFCDEVESLVGLAYNRSVGLPELPGDDIDRRYERAMAFRVGGDPYAVAAKAALRELEI